MNKLLSRFFFSLVLITSSFLLDSCGAKVPLSVDRAKMRVQKNYREIKAITDFHNLDSPFTVRDTVKIRVPQYVKSIEVNSPSFVSSVDTAFVKYVKPVLKDGVDVVKVRRDLLNAVKPEYIDKVFEDSLSVVSVFGYPDSLNVSVLIKERDIREPIEYERVVVDTEIKWYEDRFVKIAGIAIIVGVIAISIMSIINRAAK